MLVNVFLICSKAPSNTSSFNLHNKIKDFEKRIILLIDLWVFTYVRTGNGHPCIK